MAGPSDSSRYDGRMVLLPDVARLQPGDILLTTGAASEARKERKLSGAIRAATGGRFSHAMICSESPALIEALPGGVSILSLARCFAHERANIRVLRFPDPQVASRAARLAQLEVGRDYSTARAMGSVIPGATLAKLRDRGTFCSALVAQVFVAAGAELFARTAVEKTTPATIDELEDLIDVTDLIFSEGPAPRNAETLVALDGDGPPSHSTYQTELSNRHAKAVLPEVDQIIADYPELKLDIVPSHWGVLRFLLDAFDALPALTPERLEAFFDAVVELDAAFADVLGNGEWDAYFAEVSAAEEQMHYDVLRESFQPNPDIDAAALASLVEKKITQLAARRDGLEDLTRCNAGRSRAITVYLAYETRVVEAYERQLQLFREISARIR